MKLTNFNFSGIEDILSSSTNLVTLEAGSTHITSSISVRRNIITYRESEGGIEKSVPMLAVQHHEACRVMTNGDCEGQIFPSQPHKIMDSFSCSSLNTVFLYLKNKAPRCS